MAVSSREHTQVSIFSVTSVIVKLASVTTVASVPTAPWVPLPHGLEPGAAPSTSTSAQSVTMFSSSVSGACRKNNILPHWRNPSCESGKLIMRLVPPSIGVLHSASVSSCSARSFGSQACSSEMSRGQ